MNEQRFLVMDQVWQRLEPHLPGKASDAEATAKDNRLFLEAVLWRVRTGSPWRDLPPAGSYHNAIDIPLLPLAVDPIQKNCDLLALILVKADNTAQSDAVKRGRLS